MIFSTAKILPKFFYNNRKVYISLIILILAINVIWIYLDLKSYQMDLLKGQNFSDRDKNITELLLQSIANGLEKYYKEYGSYPNIHLKYFYHSLKNYIKIKDAYIYADSIDGEKVIPIKKPIKRNMKYYNSNTNYVAVGIAKKYILYEWISPNKYLLYGVGENNIDNKGKEDDIVYKKK